MTDKNGETIASAVTNLDLHDMARSARTYGVNAFYVVTPLDDQKALAAKLVDHWVNGAGARYNPKRQEAMQLIRVRDNLEQVLAETGCEKVNIIAHSKGGLDARYLISSLGMFSGVAGGGVAYGAHIGGFVAGLGLAVL